MKNVILLVFVATLILTPAIVTPVEATYFSTVNDCHLHKKSDESILINYFETKIVSHDGRTSYTKSGIHIPQGTYDVYLEGSDGYKGRSNLVQAQEKYAVGFLAHGNEVAVSNASEDVPDGQDGAFWNGKVNTNLDITDDVDSLKIFHAGDEDSLNSVSPTCILLVPQKKVHAEPKPKHPAAPICGNGIQENGEQCDDGNLHSGDGCSAMCSPERAIISPVCGNSIVEPGEQCDDGNADDEKCDTQCKLPEIKITPTPDPQPEQTPDPEPKRCSSEIGNTVFNDYNKNGVQDEGEPGIEDVKLKLQYGDKVDTDKTNFRGRYDFDDLCEDTYRVIVAVETLPHGCYQTYDRDGKLDHTYKKELGDNDDYTKADFGYHCPEGGRVSPQTGPGAIAAAASATLASAAALIGHRRLRKQSGTIISFE